MSRRTIVWLVLATAAAGALAVWARAERRAAASVDAGGPLLPGLAERLDDVESLSVLSGGERFGVRREDGEWVMPDKGGFPVRFETVKRTLVGLAGLERIEAKTSNPALYARLGVEDPGLEGAGSTLITVHGEGGRAIASVIVGDMTTGGSGRYVRLEGESQSWQVRGELMPERMPVDWLEKDVLRLEAVKVRSVRIEHGDGEVVIASKETAEDPAWTLQGVPEGRQASGPGAVRALAGSLEFFSFDDVASRESRPLPEAEPATTVLETFDGLRLVALSAADEDGAIWVSFDASADAAAGPAGEAPSEAAASLAAELQERLGRWVFRLPDYRASALRKRMDDLVVDVPPPPAESAEPEAAAEPPAAAPEADEP